MRPQGTKLEEPAQPLIAVPGRDQDALTVEGVAEPAERHREAALVAAVAAPLAGGGAELREVGVR